MIILFSCLFEQHEISWDLQTSKWLDMWVCLPPPRSSVPARCRWLRGGPGSGCLKPVLMRDFSTAAGSQQLNGKHHKYLICPGRPQYTPFPHQNQTNKKCFSSPSSQSQSRCEALPSQVAQRVEVQCQGEAPPGYTSIPWVSEVKRSIYFLQDGGNVKLLTDFLNPVRQPQDLVLCYKQALHHTPKAQMQLD